MPQPTSAYTDRYFRTGGVRLPATPAWLVSRHRPEPTSFHVPFDTSLAEPFLDRHTALKPLESGLGCAVGDPRLNKWVFPKCERKLSSVVNVENLVTRVPNLRLTNNKCVHGGGRIKAAAIARSNDLLNKPQHWLTVTIQLHYLGPGSRFISYKVSICWVKHSV